jgi:NAD(P)-dependent dehydrogenase (short-subunit alcohol dehydrogenase family)
LVNGASETLQDNVSTLTCNIADFDDVTRCFAALQEEVGYVDILVNNAAEKCEKTVLETTPEEWEQVLATNTDSILYTCKQVFPQMKERRTGKLINVSSPAVSGVAGNAAYAVSMAAMLGVHYTMSRETERYTTTCCTLSPAGNATPEEIADVALLAATEDGRFLHGQIVSVTHTLAQ